MEEYVENMKEYVNNMSYPRTYSKAGARDFSKSCRRGGEGATRKIQIYPRVKIFGWRPQ